MSTVPLDNNSNRSDRGLPVLAPASVARTTVARTTVASTTSVRSTVDAPPGSVTLGGQRRQLGAVAMASVALLALSLRRMDYDSGLIMVVEAVLAAIALGLACLARPRRTMTAASTLRIGPINRLASAPLAPVPIVTVLGVAAAIGLPWLVDLVGRSFGFGNGMEIVMLGSLAWGGMAAAIVGRTSKTLSISIICSGFLTLFTTFIADSPWAALFAYLWIAMCLWWLVANHWERVELTDASSIQSMPQVGWVYLTLGVFVFCVATCLVGDRIPVLRTLAGEIMPTSGGTSQTDSAARYGIGNGDALVAAQEHASSFGAVETDLFLDSDQPSLFDVFSDEFGEPRQKNRVERAQALDPSETRSDEGQFAETNRANSGGEFDTERKRPRLSQPPSDLASQALMFWEGAAGAHLAIERYNAFDGLRWTQKEPAESSSQSANVLVTSSVTPVPVVLEDRTWFKPPLHRSSGRYASSNPFVDAVPEALKFTRFRSSTIPTQSGIKLWSIDKVTIPEFFAFSADDCLSMPGRLHVPDYTVVRFVNSHIDLHRVDNLLHTRSPCGGELPLAGETLRELRALSKEFAGSETQGWPQVAALVDGMRQTFTWQSHLEGSSAEVASSSASTPTDEFLKHRRGPSYMFATVTALLLQDSGYETRLVSGFYVNPRHYLAGDDEYAIQSQDAHVWLELRVGKDLWIPLEPTPGFRQPHYRGSWWYAMRQARGPLLWWTALLLLTGGLAYVGRAIWIEGLCWVAAPVLELLPIRWRIVWLARLLDLRLRLTGHSRPASRVPRAHLSPLLRTLPERQACQLRQFLDASDSIRFGRSENLSLDQRLAIRSVWSEVTCYRIRAAFDARPLAN